MKSYKNRKIDISRPVWVHRNLNRGGYSILQRGLVVAHSDSVLLVNVKPVIRQAGWRKYRETGVRNVHAFMVGRIANLSAGGRGAYGISGDEPKKFTNVAVKYDSNRGAFVSRRRRLVEAGGVFLTEKVWVAYGHWE